MSKRRLRIVVIVRCPLCGGWIVGNAYSEHLECVHLAGAERGLQSNGCGPGDRSPPIEVIGADTPTERFGEAGSLLTPSEAGELLSELGRRYQQGLDASLGFLIHD